MLLAVRTGPIPRLPDVGEPGAVWFFHCHPVISACRVEWRGISRAGEILLDASDVGVGFAVGPSMWRHGPSLDGVAYRREGPLFAASCRSFRLAIGRGLGPALRIIGGLEAPDEVRRAALGRLAKAASESMNEAEAETAVREWTSTAGFADDVRHFGRGR